MPFIDRDDGRTFFETVGEGPPLLLVAGIASDVASWAPIVPLLEQDFQLIMFDNRGAGRTEQDGAISAEDWIGDVMRVLDHLKIDEADIVGHSLGSMIASRAAVRAPNRFGKLVLSAASAIREPKALALMQEMSALYQSDMEPETWFRLLFQWLFAPPFFADPVQVTEAGKLAAAYEYCQSPEDFGRQVDGLAGMPELDASELSNETLLLLAEHDLMTPPNASIDSFAGAPNLKHQIIAGAGHSIHWDQPEAFADAVRDYLKS